VFDLVSQLEFDSALEILNVCFETLGYDDARPRLEGAQVNRRRHGGRTQGRRADHRPFAAEAVV